MNDLFSKLPDELLELIVYNLSPRDTVYFGLSCKRAERITHEALVWRRHCTTGWRYWADHHDIKERLSQPPARTKWRQLYNLRKKQDDEALAIFNTMLLSQQRRLQYFEELTSMGYDIKDLMLHQENDTPGDAEDLLARRFYARSVRAKLHRDTAIHVWDRLRQQQMVPLYESLGAFDLFALSGESGDLRDIDNELNRLQLAVVKHYPDFELCSTRNKAVRIATYLRYQGILGMDVLESYHALRHNFISLALLRSPHRSLPLQSAAIYCAVARRLGVDARPSNFPGHVYVVVIAPQGFSLDGAPRYEDQYAEREIMHMDPWRSNDEVEQSQLVSRLTQMGTAPHAYAALMGPCSTRDITMRAGRNIMHSVTSARDAPAHLHVSSEDPDGDIDTEKAFYGMLWATMMIGDGDLNNSLARRRSCLPYLIQHYQTHFPEDVGLLTRYIVPLFMSQAEVKTLHELVAAIRADDRNKKPPCPRNASAAGVRHKVGAYFVHARYGYSGVVIGWDSRCEAGEQWIHQMRVNELPQGREQPFYHVLADDKSIRYVAQENIKVADDKPHKVLMQEAGRYFKRWDAQNRVFVSNIRDEYPDD